MVDRCERAPLQENEHSGAFPRSNRLTKPGEFKRVFANARKVATPHLTLLGRSNDQGRPRLGLAIAKKHLKSAVRRNRVKRQIRESFRLHKADLGNIDIVVLARPGIKHATPQELRAALEKCWRALAKRCEKS